MRADLSRAKILLRRSKTDQDGLGRWPPLSQRTTVTLATFRACLTLEVTRLLSPPSNLKDALFASLPLLSRHLTKSIHASDFKIKGLQDCRVPRIIRALTRKAGLYGEQIKGFPGHSLRVGSAQELPRAGEPMPLITTRGGLDQARQGAALH
jgi:hypothetical protein